VTTAESDIALANAVRRAIEGDPTLPAGGRRVLATVERGVVRLTGTVSAGAEAEDARIAVARVPGFRRIDNRMIVAGRWRSRPLWARRAARRGRDQ
jgi:osmotically-inducible protein OsmY